MLGASDFIGSVYDAITELEVRIHKDPSRCVLIPAV